MFTLTILLILAVMVALFGCLMGLFSIIGLLFSLLTGILVGALAGYLASRFMGTQTSFLRNVVLGVLGSFVGEFLFGMFHIYATGSFSSFVISVVGACVCIGSSFMQGSSRKPFYGYLQNPDKSRLLP